MRVFVVAAEASGDAIAADFIRALRARVPDVTIAGVGGAAMAGEGVKSAASIAGLSVLGLFEGLKVYGRVVRAADQTAEAARAFDPDVVVLVDSWGFMLRVALRIRRMCPRARIVKYIGPQIWATRPGRARALARTVDHVICLFAIEAPAYAALDLPATVCGYPALGRFVAGDGAAFRARHGLDPQTPVILVLPGSRPAELRGVAPALWRAGLALKVNFPEARLVTVAASSVADTVRAQAPRETLIVTEDEKGDAFAAATVALAASGTVTTELALQGAPVIVGYRLGWFTWLVARFFLYKARFISILNVIADAEVMPEFMQTRLTVENIVAAASPLLNDPDKRRAQINAQNEALRALGRGARPASEIAVDVVVAEAARGGDQPRLPTVT